MGMHDTTAGEEATKRLREAQKGIQSLQKWLATMSEEIDKHEAHCQGVAFPIAWASEMMSQALAIYNEIARCNGAVLVRAIEPVKKPEQEKKGSMINCECTTDERCTVCGGPFPRGRIFCQNGHLKDNKYAT